MGVFERFPYTNFHEMNLDWLLSRVKELAEEWMKYHADWDKWQGDVEEALADMKQYIIDSFDTLELQEYVDKWLDEHPEATTTVLDGSITEKKLAMSLKKKALAGDLLAPIYVGDYMCSNDYLPSSCVRIENVFYTINAPQRARALSQRTNEGIIRKFDLQTNAEILTDAHVANVGHGNSAAYDPTNQTVYVVPIWDTTTGTEVNARYLYIFDNEMLPLGTVNTPTQAMGVTFDDITEKLYYIDYDRDVYVMGESGWQLYSVVDFTGVVENEMYSRGYIQDLAIHDDMFYISSPNGNIVFGELKEGTSEIISMYNVAAVDSIERFRLGEIEGMEFFEGHLYALDYIQLSGEVLNAFVVELPVKTAIEHSTNIDGGNFRLSDGTLTLSEESQTKFALKTYEIRSLLQLKSMILSPLSSAVRIPENNNVVDPYQINLVQDLTLFLDGTYTLKYFEVYKGHLNVYTNGAGNKVIFTHANRGFEVLRAGRLTLSGGQRLNVSMPNASTGNNFIYIGTYKPITSIRLTPVSIEGFTLMIGSAEAENGFYTGSYKIGE